MGDDLEQSSAFLEPSGGLVVDVDMLGSTNISHRPLRLLLSQRLSGEDRLIAVGTKCLRAQPDCFGHKIKCLLISVQSVPHNSQVVHDGQCEPVFQT